MTDTPATFEAKKDRLYQTQDGLWKLTLTVQQCDMPNWLLRAPMGQRIGAAALHEIGDDEKPVTDAELKAECDRFNAAQNKPEKTEGERAVIRAAILCSDIEFQAWSRKEFEAAQGAPVSGMWGPSTTATWLRSRLGVSSRSEIATDSAALDKFLKMETSFRYRNELR